MILYMKLPCSYIQFHIDFAPIDIFCTFVMQKFSGYSDNQQYSEMQILCKLVLENVERIRWILSQFIGLVFIVIGTAFDLGFIRHYRSLIKRT